MTAAAAQPFLPDEIAELQADLRELARERGAIIAARCCSTPAISSA